MPTPHSLNIKRGGDFANRWVDLVWDVLIFRVRTSGQGVGMAKECTRVFSVEKNPLAVKKAPY